MFRENGDFGNLLSHFFYIEFKHQLFGEKQIFFTESSPKMGLKGPQNPSGGVRGKGSLSPIVYQY